jgi:opacity protein-like surface antigen
MLRNSLFGTAAMALLLAGPAAAEGWDGPYVGIGLGYGQTGVDFPNGTNQYLLNGVSIGGAETEFSAPGGHVLAGQLWQRDQWLMGYEVDASFGETAFADRPVTDIADPTSFCGAPDCLFLGVLGEFATIGHLRGIFGREIGPKTMAYLGAGLAVGRGEVYGMTVAGYYVSDSNPADPPLLGAATVTRLNDNRRTFVGGSVALGLAHKLSERLVLRGEVVYDFYPEQDMVLGGVGFGGTIDGKTVNSFLGDGGSVSFNNTSLRVALIYRF